MDWIDKTGETWTYTHANRFKISGDVTASYPIGTKIRLKQGGSYKYFYVVGLEIDASFTYIIVNGGTAYSLANASITDNYIHYGAEADGFPNALGYLPTWTTTSGTSPSIGNGSMGGTFNMFGPWVSFNLGLTVGTTTGVGNGGQWRFTLPVQNAAGFPSLNGQIYAIDTGNQSYEGTILVDSANTWRPSATLTNGTNAVSGGITQTTPFAWGNTDLLQCSGSYEVYTVITQL